MEAPLDSSRDSPPQGTNILIKIDKTRSQNRQSPSECFMKETHLGFGGCRDRPYSVSSVVTPCGNGAKTLIADYG